MGKSDSSPQRRRMGDRRDGKLIRNIDPMHLVMPMIYPNRCDNEAYISEKIALAPIEKWLEEHNENETEFKYTMFHIVVSAILKAITLRPKMNRFIANKNMYQRNKVSAAFVVKKKFDDESEEGLAIIYADPDDTVFTLHQKLYNQIKSARSDKLDTSSNSMDIFSKLPRPVCKIVAGTARFLDRHGMCPKAFIETDPYYASVVLSNLGSIKLKCGYHHLTNWGTNSLFCIIGQIAETPVLQQDGTTSLQKTVELGLTIDERLADGYYYSKTVRLLKKLLENPELLEKPMSEKVDY